MALSLDRNDFFYYEAIQKRVKERGKRRNEVNPIRFTKEFPECLIYEILSWLPVKSLVRFKSVCKSWRTMIKTKSFVSKNMQQRYYYQKDDKCRNCLIVAYNVLPNEVWYYQYLVDEKSRRVLAVTEIYKRPPSSQIFCGPCDGLYYVCCSYRSDDGRRLWNPTLKHCKILPPVVSKHNLPSNRYFAFWDNNYGFGFDPVTQDYKVVIIKDIVDASDNRLEMPPGVLVYSLRTDSWKYVADLPKYYELRDNKSYVFANKSLYWLASNPCSWGNQAIIAFNLATDECREIQLPMPPSDEYDCDYECLMVYRGNMAFVKVDQKMRLFCVWALKKRKWVEKLRMSLHFMARKPLGQWRDGLLIFETKDCQNLIICNLDTLKSWVLKVRKSQPYYWCNGICAYEESIIHLH
ncbi:putative F-box protein At3g16210 [Silene latifolia]|uniref:putative F-box protein At3g16210 n=1 Tax=Silene latifolia TaxID=37657 RepID=UPI003D7885F6